MKASEFMKLTEEERAKIFEQTDDLHFVITPLTEKFLTTLLDEIKNGKEVIEGQIVVQKEHPELTTYVITVKA
ncbi:MULTISPECIES: hypothetical protein [Klebsiella]|uniref:hypothetical protein n=1 Tax=Klebsiella pneumoniae complex TaxID=3390273 RepID=UPI000E2A59F7|nr:MULTISPECIES: hypothetical protein [Klebsiella]MBX4829513.1 hypothetical protein [Klebsiella pneumoniae]MDE4777549.1 hypothetical protein [Klebsiella quasipneumoniae subsp. similipneumoniae]SWL39201.1 Uncharacterised protein [Klebsiella pneumoniae]HBR1269421.1 hypothetical protein [Klebsiella pneumoniae]HBZ1143993.1 hypothetical protein [Klebsiella pneumoniae]